jgi:hypothetical protein
MLKLHDRNWAPTGLVKESSFSRLFASFALAGCLAMSGCSVKTVRNEENSAAGEVLSPVGASGVDAVSADVSLRADRSELDKLRSEIPDDVKAQNDEIALVLSYVYRDSEEEPNRLRDRFQAAIRKRREAMDKQLRRSRDSFSKEERRSREDYLRNSKEERDEFLERKRTSDERKKFFEEQEDRRRVFFADQAEKRKDFESQVQDERKRLEDFVREKQNQFNQEWREYQSRYSERRRLIETKKKMEEKARKLEQRQTPTSNSGVPSALAPSAVGAQVPNGSLEEFNKIPAGPGIPLDPTKKGP